MYVNEATLVDRITVKAKLLGEHLSMDHGNLAKSMTIRPRQRGWIPGSARRTDLWKLSKHGSLWIDKDGTLYQEYWSDIRHEAYCMKAELEKKTERRQSRILEMLEHPNVVDWS